MVEDGGILNERDENESWRILSKGWILLCIRFICFIVPRITLFAYPYFQDPQLRTNQRIKRKEQES